METVWERRRLKRETLEPEDMHTVRGGGISALARLGPWDLPDISEALSPMPVWLIWPLAQIYWLFAFHSYLSKTCPSPTPTCLPVPFYFLGILQFNQRNFIKYLLSDYFVAGTMLGTGHQRVN